MARIEHDGSHAELCCQLQDQADSGARLATTHAVRSRDVAYVAWFNEERLHQALGDIPPQDHGRFLGLGRPEEVPRAVVFHAGHHGSAMTRTGSVVHGTLAWRGITELTHNSPRADG